LERKPDVLGYGFWQQTLPLASDDEGPVVATLIGKACPRPSRRAVLYLHGFVDYFFQREMAETYLEAGFNFYALDLRKYGRSLRAGQTPNFCRDVGEYFEELDQALVAVRADGNERVLLSGHSTGGLVAALYAHERRDAGAVDALFLNSPFFEFNAGWFTRKVMVPLVAALGRSRPRRVLPMKLSPLYGESLHRSRRGAWDYQLEWKPIEGFPLRAGWLRAIHLAQQRLHAGLAITRPILLMYSDASSWARSWDETLLRADAILDVKHIRAHANDLGDHVTSVRIAGGMHDLTLSAPAVREGVWREVRRFCQAYL
jgi:alpha-beta hydrolase superfamily lysophospholipase